MAAASPSFSAARIFRPASPAAALAQALELALRDITKDTLLILVTDGRDPLRGTLHRRGVTLPFSSAAWTLIHDRPVTYRGGLLYDLGKDTTLYASYRLLGTVGPSAAQPLAPQGAVPGASVGGNRFRALRHRGLLERQRSSFQ